MTTGKREIDFIYWLAFYNLDSPSVRYRAKYPLDHWRSSRGVESWLIIPGYSPKRIFLFLRAYFSALVLRKRNSIIVIQKVRSSFIYSLLLLILVKIRRSDTFYDIDDADYLEYPPRRLYRLVEACEKVACGSVSIANHLRKFNPNVYHITSPIWDMGIAKKERSGVFTLGWVGGFGGDHRRSLLDEVFPAIRALDYKMKFILLGVMTDEDESLVRAYFQDCDELSLHIPRKVDWSDELAIQNYIVQFDVGFATLSNTEFQLAKSGIKAKQYLNNGVPVLSSDLPENNSVVKHGYNGYFCNSAREFQERIVQLYNLTSEEYNKLSQCARLSVAPFDHDNYYEAFLSALNTASAYNYSEVSKEFEDREGPVLL